MAAELVHTALLPAVPPFALGTALRAMSGFAPCAGDQLVTADRVRKAFPVSGTEAAVVEVAGRPDGAPGVALSVFAQRALSPPETGALESRIRRWLSLDDDLAPFFSIARRDPAMRPILAATHGLHQVRFASLAEATVYFTLTQRSTQWFAAARKRRIAAELGPRLSLDGVDYVAFPDFPALASVDFDGFAGNPARGRRVAEVVAGVAALDEDWLRTAPYPEARDVLLHVRGAGPMRYRWRWRSSPVWRGRSMATIRPGRWSCATGTGLMSAGGHTCRAPAWAGSTRTPWPRRPERNR